MSALHSIRGLLTSAANTNSSTLGDTAAVEEVDCANNRSALEVYVGYDGERRVQASDQTQ